MNPNERAASSGGEDIKTWKKDLAAAVILVKETIMNDQSLNIPTKLWAWKHISNATQLAASLCDEGHHDIIKETKLVSTAVAEALDALSTGRQLSEKELDILADMGGSKEKFAELEAKSKNLSRTLNSAGLETVRMELETLQKIGA